jgi:enamine deaminase RidA (YjgF/YER057c/UK114 family)
MENQKRQIQTLNMPWEDEYGYAQAVKLDSTVWISGQFGHDEQGKLAKSMEDQILLTYQNIKNLLATYGLTMDNVVEEVIYTTKIKKAFELRKEYGRQVYTNPKTIASTIVEVSGLALPDQLVEIKVVAVIG